MNKNMKLFLVGASLIACQAQAGVPTLRVQKPTLLSRLKKAVPAIAKVAVFGTVSSIAMDYSLKNFSLLIPGADARIGQIRKICFHTFGPIMAAIAYEFMSENAPEVEGEYETLTKKQK